MFWQAEYEVKMVREKLRTIIMFLFLGTETSAPALSAA